MKARTRVYVSLALTAALAACAPATTRGVTPVPSAVVVTAAGASTVIPVTVAPLPPGATAPPATVIPTLPSGATPTELKYQVLAQFPNLFFCDPDYYPVARADETDLAQERFPELRANAEEFQTILSHTGLGGLSTFSAEQQLLIYREHKRLAAVAFEVVGDQYRFRLQTEESSGEGFSITGLIDSRGSITIEQRDAGFPTCPICLAGQTQIDTPGGPVAVEDLRVGDVVWTVDAAGARVSTAILTTVRVLVPAQHRMVHVVLDDGRELWASPGHPTSDGRALLDLKLGERLGGALITRVESVDYDQPATYDLLPAGGTGFYWANGILLASTLAK